MENFLRMATACPSGYSPNKHYRRGRRQCLKTRAPKPTLRDLQALAMQNDVSVFKRRKDDMGFTKQPLTKTALKHRLSKMKVPYAGAAGAASPSYAQALATGVPVVQGTTIAPMDFGFGMATVCPPGRVPNPFWKKGRGHRQCVVKVQSPKKTLKQLQSLARKHSVSIYKRRKDDRGFTRSPLSIKALKYRLSRMKVAY